MVRYRPRCSAFILHSLVAYSLLACRTCRRQPQAHFRQVPRLALWSGPEKEVGSRRRFIPPPYAATNCWQMHAVHPMPKGVRRVWLSARHSRQAQFAQTGSWAGASSSTCSNTASMRIVYTRISPQATARLIQPVMNFVCVGFASTIRTYRIA